MRPPGEPQAEAGKWDGGLVRDVRETAEAYCLPPSSRMKVIMCDAVVFVCSSGIR